MNPVILLTGGAGFLGRAIIEELLTPDHSGMTPPSEIRVLDVRPVHVDHKSIVSITGDIRSYDDVLMACRGVDIVIHAASIVDWGRLPEELLNDVNVKGTENVIKACQESGVKGLVYTSTMDVVYDSKPIRNGNEQIPYPETYDLAYARTKAAAEQAVIRANGSERASGKNNHAAGCRLYTTVIRPCGMYGEADPYHISETLKMLKKGRLTFRIGDGKAVFQHVYVGNVAHAHVLAAYQLLKDNPKTGGEVYIITDVPAVNFFDFLEPITAGVGYPLPPKNRSIPFPVMLAIGALLEFTAFITRPFIKFHPTITRTSIRMVCEDICFDGSKAVRELGYTPVYSEEESVDRTVAYFKAHGPLS